MRTTPPLNYRYDPLNPRGIVVFLTLAALWIIWGFLPDLDYWPLHVVARLSGYIALIGMLIPYWHIAQRALRAQPTRRMSQWLRWHIAASYVGFAFLLLHCHGRASSPLTLTLLWLTWIVMISGVVGFYGQKLLYSLLSRFRGIPEEVGLERLEPERIRIVEAGRREMARKEMTGAPAVVQEFMRATVDGFLDRPYSFWRPRRRGVEDPAVEVEARDYEHAFLLASDTQRPVVESLWALVEARRRLNSEYRFHQLGRFWLVFHGPAAWVLLVLMFEHVWKSWRYGGF